MSITQWLRQLFGKTPKIIGPMPKGACYIHENGTWPRPGDQQGVIIIQQPPQKRSILLSYRRYENKTVPEGSVFLLFPYTVFIIRYVRREDRYVYMSLQVGFSKMPVTGPGDMLCGLPLSNYDGDCPMSVCMGVGVNRGFHDTLDGMVKMAISHYWQSRFTNLNPHTIDQWGCSPEAPIIPSCTIREAFPFHPKAEFFNG